MRNRVIARGGMVLLAMAVGFGIGTRAGGRAGRAGDAARDGAAPTPPAALVPAGDPSLAAEGETPPSRVDPAFGADPLWDDGKAEVARYAATARVYGAERAYEAVLITVKEDLNAASLVKADPPYEGKILLPSLKLNLVHEIPTGNYDDRYLASVFVARDDPFRLRKLTVGSQEWCGNTFQELLPAGARAVLHFHSYFEGEGDGARELELGPGDLVDEQAPVALRCLPFREGLTFRARLLGPLTSNRARPARARDFDFSVNGRETAEVPAGAIAAWRVEAREVAGARTLVWRFAEAPPHVLVSFDGGDGRTLALREVARRVYW